LTRETCGSVGHPVNVKPYRSAGEGTVNRAGYHWTKRSVLGLPVTKCDRAKQYDRAKPHMSHLLRDLRDLMFESGSQPWARRAQSSLPARVASRKIGSALPGFSGLAPASILNRRARSSRRFAEPVRPLPSSMKRRRSGTTSPRLLRSESNPSLPSLHYVQELFF
jgi:hypothetical protein